LRSWDCPLAFLDTSKLSAEEIDDFGAALLVRSPAVSAISCLTASPPSVDRFHQGALRPAAFRLTAGGSSNSFREKPEAYEAGY